MLYAAVLLIFTLIFMVIYLLLGFFTRDKQEIKNRLAKLGEMELPEEEKLEDHSLLERMVLPLYQKVTQLLVRITPGKKMEMLNKKLEKAGIAKNDATRWMFNKTIGTIVVTLVFCLLIYSIKPDLVTVLLFGAIIFLFMNVLSNFYISGRIENRKKSIQKDLPYILDLITVSVEAGLSFDGAIARVVNSVECHLCTEFGKCLKEMRMGIPKKIALRSMSDRCDVRELSLLVTSIIQADELGVSLGNVLRIESGNIREHRKQMVKERAMKVPIKMLIPMIIFIFPTIFVIILGPAVIQVMHMLAS